jgi:hypothetical protein
MSNSTARKERQPRRRVWQVVLAVVVVLLVLAGLFLLVRRGSVERRLKALRAAGYPTSFAELAEYTQLPEGADNAAGLYVDAFTAYSRPVDEANVPLLGTAELPPRGSPLPEPMAEAVSACLARNAGCLALLRRAGELTQCRYPWDYTTTGRLPNLADVRSCARLLELAAIVHAERDDAAAALACVKDGLRLADSLANEPSLLIYLLRTACYALSLQGLERVLSATDLPDESLRDLDEHLATIGRSVDLGDMLVTERALMIGWCGDPTPLGGFGGGTILMRTPGLWTVTVHDCLDYMGDYIEAAKLPPRDRLARFAEIGQDAHGRSLLHAVSAMMLPSLTRVAELDLRLRAHLDLARTALAIERHRLATGEIPAELGQLVPRYLDAVPIDPFDGQPIRYRRTEPGYVLYSILADGQDNGGRAYDQDSPDAPYDWSFIVTR